MHKDSKKAGIIAAIVVFALFAWVGYSTRPVQTPEVDLSGVVTPETTQETSRAVEAPTEAPKPSTGESVAKQETESVPSEFESGLLDAVNAERTKVGVPVLTRSSLLHDSSQDRAEDMAERDYLAHYTPENVYGPRTILEHGYQYRKSGEVISAVWDSPREVVDAWMASPTHRDIILSTDFAEAGFGIAVGLFEAYPGQTIVVGHFGVR